MKTLLPLSAVLWLAGAALAFAAEPAAALPKTHALFMGADIIVEKDKKQYRIEDVSGSQFKITVDGHEVFIPTRNRQTGLGVAYNLKLSGSSVKLDDLHSGPAYSPQNDPMKHLKDAAGNAAATQAAADAAQAAMTMAVNHEIEAQNALDRETVPEAKAALQAEISRAQSDIAKAEQQVQGIQSLVTSDFTNAGAGAHRMAVEEGNFDAMSVSFKVSSEVELTSPFMVVLFRFHEPGAKPGVDGLVIHAQALDPINAKPSYVRVLRTGLPMGFKFVDCTVHIYNRGREVATNVSEKRVDLTHSEAQQYFLLEYVSANKGATAPAAGVPGSLPPAERERLSHEQLTRTLFVKVSGDGTPLGVFTDADCNHPLKDTAIAMATEEIFFKPALNHGKPIEGVARLRLADL
jgi:hypothetical protein